MEELIEERRDRVLLVTLNRPDRLNAFTGEQYARLGELLNRVRDDDTVSAVVVTGSGRAFSSGDDLSLHEDADLARQANVAFDGMLESLLAFDKPLVAAVNGLAIGFGATFLLHFDVVLASTEARLRYPFTEMGVAPEAASSALLPSLVGPQRAAELFFAADWIDADRAFELGLFARLLPADALLEGALDLAARFSERSLPALQATKRLLLHDRRQAVLAAHARETEATARLTAEWGLERSLDPAPADDSFDPTPYRTRIVSTGVPEGGFATFMSATAHYFTNGDVAMPEGVIREVILTTADEKKQFIILFFEAKAEEAIKAQYGATVDDASWKSMETGAKESGMMEDPVQFRYLDGSALFCGATSISIPDPGAAMPAVAGWPADFPSIEGAIVQADAPVSAKGVHENARLADKWKT